MIHLPSDIFSLWILVVPVGIVGTAIGIGASLLGGLLGGGPSKEEKAALASQSALARQQARISRERGTREKSFFAQQQPIISKLIDQFTALLGGDRGAIAQRFGPLLEDLASQRKSTQENILQSTPAGGAQVQGLIEAEGKAFSERSSILRGAPEAGAAGLTGIAQLLGQGAQGQAAAATGAGGIAGGALESILASEQSKKLLDQNFFDSLLGSFKGIGADLFKKKNESENKVFNL